MKRMISLDVVEQILNDDTYLDTKYIGVAPGTDRLGEEHWMFFEYEGLLWRVMYVQGNSYWRSEMGAWETPFPQADFKAGEVECEQVEKVAVTTYSYIPVSESSDPA